MKNFYGQSNVMTNEYDKKYTTRENVGKNICLHQDTFFYLKLYPRKKDRKKRQHFSKILISKNTSIKILL